MNDLAVPILHNMDIKTYLSHHPPDETVFNAEKWIASIFVSFSILLMFVIAKRSVPSIQALSVAVTFALGTSAWSTASRGLWQHGPSMLALSMALYLLLLYKEKTQFVQYVGGVLAFAYIIRPTNAIPLILISIYVFFAARPYFNRYLFWSLLILLPFYYYSSQTYQTLIPPYYVPGWWGENPSPIQSLPGTLISPSRGLFVFSPVLLFSLYGIALRLKTFHVRSLEFYIAATILLHWIVISHRLWYGGWSLGPRLFTDVLPFFAYFLIPVVERFPESIVDWKLPTHVFILLLAFSIFVHFRCALSWGPDQWNSVPNNIDQNKHRLWDWYDMQFLRGLCKEPFYAAPGCWIGGQGRQGEIPQVYEKLSVAIFGLARMSIFVSL
jgi:hypothetical protein